MITKRELLKILSKVPDDAVVVVPSEDHSYRLAEVSRDTALYDRKSRTFSEDFGEDVTPEADYGTRVPVLVVE